ncbi:AraC family transcriptional regulator [Draconibacterium sp. IB214405]|uniref:helix-turn-helix domain-containing protein n=1 Tax=Draconibacterium sp. IB214405 TaxID=3097352 RepID=UPI002A128558|nr:AraC family transcriptional regulator [Draconibacterium sp. IB214405]MDX8338795.1 AraC family transcriptional regulator [Draconibacterium sp. IB214405]
MEITFLNAIELLAGFQAFLFAIYLIFNKEGKRLSNFFIAIFIMLLAYNVLDFFADLILKRWSENITVLLQLFIYLAAPALYLHIKTSLFPNYKLKTQDLWHTLPFFILLGVVLSLIVYEIRQENVPAKTERIVGLAFYAVLYLQTFLYLYFANRQLTKHKEIFFENYSNTNTKRYGYISNLILFVAVLFSLSMVNIFTRWVFQFESFSFISYVVITAVLILFCWLIILGLRSPELFIDETEAQPSVQKLVKQNVDNSALKSEDENNKMAERVNQYMKEEEPFLDASLTLHTLAKETKISSRELSILINHHLNKHFFDFVNEYRIEKAMELLTSPDRKEYTVLEILYEVGFNSKSSFNTAFKKHTGFTPTEYRRKNSMAVA